jgi:hypothetical protein
MQISDFEKLDVAAITFKNKYGALPGDLRPTQATNFGFANRVTGDYIANNDGRLIAVGCGSDASVLGEYGNQPAAADEANYFFNDLSVAQLVPKTYPLSYPYTPSTGNVYPRLRIGTGYFYPCNSAVGDDLPASRNKSYFVTFNVDTDMANGTYSNALSPMEAYSIDVKLDDGLPDTGLTLATDSTSVMNIISYPNGNGQCTDGANHYLTDTEANADFPAICSLAIRTSF